MDRDSSLEERRYSFYNYLKNPAAESTKLNYSNANRSGLGTSFKWGSSPISPKQRSNSSVNLINLESCTGDDTFDNTRRRSLRKIDPRIVADVQSKGLASRIVKYHENGSRLNRSMSAHNLYSKPGQFPVVTLKKTELPYRATKQNVSMTRIVPPDKSVFYGSTLSSLLRSNSVVGLHKSDEDISRENRPILHPPPTENDMAPTRSVLDVLKEISRKRINSDDPDVVDTSKKNKIGNDLVDTGAQTIMTQSFKRQRDLNSPQGGGDAISPSTFQGARFSPEQAKKRVCNYNNDITSSLSSSIKRKPMANKRSSAYLNQTMPTSLESYETQKNKTLKCDSHITNNDIRFSNLENTTSRVVVPHTGSKTVPDGATYGAVPSRSKSDPSPYENGKISVVNNKPRLTLFNKAYEVNTDNFENTEEDVDDLDVSGECAGIQFVKPKKSSSTGLKNPIIERTQKSKLALMLSGLRGELYNENESDELDAPVHQTKADKKNEETVTKAVQDNKKASTILPLQNTFTSASNVTSITVPTANTLPEKPKILSNTTQFSNKTISSGSPLVGLKMSPPTTVVNTSTAQKPAVISTPTLQGFSPGSSIGTPAQSVATFVATTSAGSLGTTVSLSTSTVQSTFVTTPMAAASKTIVSSSTELAKASTNPSAVSFGSFANVTTTTTAAVAPNSFSFSTTNVGNTIALTTTSAASTGQQPPSVVTAAPNVPASSTTASTMFSNSFTFGAKTAATTAPTQSQTFAMKPLATPSSPATFSLGSNLNVTSSVTPTAKSSGGFSLANVAPVAAPNTQFNFGSAVAANNHTPAAGNVLNFGLYDKDKSTQLTTTTPKTTPALTSIAETTKSPFGLSAPPSAYPVFGTVSATTASNTFAPVPNTSSVASMFGATATKPVSSNAPVQPIFGSSDTKTTTSNEQSQSIFGSTTAKTTSSNVTAQALFGSMAAITNNSSNELNKALFGSTPPITTSSNVPQTKSIFGSTVPKTTTSNAPIQSIFGSTAPTPSFGSENGKPATSLFGGSSAVVAFGQPATEKAGTINKSTAATGGFSFGQTASAAAPSSGTFTFGGANNNTSNPNNANSSQLSTGQTANFSFGAAASAPEKNSSTNLFGGSTVVARPTENSVGGFSFGSTATPAPKPPSSSTFTFGAPSTSSSGVGGNSSQSSSAAAGGFSFGSVMQQQKINDTPAAKPFSFGSSLSSSNQSLVPTSNNPVVAPTNMFASNALNKTATPAFAFGAPTGTPTPQATVAPAAVNNIFAPPANMSVTPGSSDRPIRRATRRLQK